MKGRSMLATFLNIMQIMHYKNVSKSELSVERVTKTDKFDKSRINCFNFPESEMW